MANSQPRFLPDATAPAVAWLFPGQGSQEVGMGADLWRTSAAARQVYETADRVLGYKLSEVCFEGPEERLRETEHTQPAIAATSLACLAAAVEGGFVTERPAFMAGHSIGEYSALVAAGALSLEDGLLLVRERGRLMAKASVHNPGTLAAILGLDEATVRSICDEAGADICNLNLPSQTVLGGSRAAVAKAMELAKARGAARAMELNVSGAFHSSLMQPAVPGMVAAIRRAAVSEPVVAVVGNLSAAPLTDGEAIRAELGAQLASPVRWHESIELIAASGVSTFIEFGPGRVLTGMAKRLVPGATLINVSGQRDLAGRSSAAVNPG